MSYDIATAEIEPTSPIEPADGEGRTRPSSQFVFED